MAPNLLLVCLWAVLTGTLASTTGSVRDVVPFSYAWRFHYGPEPDEQAGPGAEAMSFPKDVSSWSCTGLYQSPCRFLASDCQTCCAYDTNCFVWFANDTIKQCWHGGPDAACAPRGGGQSMQGFEGFLRTTAPSPRTNYTFAHNGLDTSSWQIVDAPHDFVISTNNSFQESADEHHGYLPRNVSWYRKTFSVPTEWQGSHIYLHFEGVFHYAQIWLNGVFIAAAPSGYNDFTVRLDNISSLAYGTAAQNTLALRADASYGSGHWYEGGGIYRDVWLVRTGSVHFVHSGIHVVSEIGAQLSNLASVNISCSAEFETLPSSSVDAQSTAAVRFEVFTTDTNALIGSAVSPMVPVLSQGTSSVSAQVVLNLSGLGALWSVQTPTLYRVAATLVLSTGGQDAVVADTLNITAGFRQTLWSSSTGFQLNGKDLKFRGFSHHNSFTGVGVAMPPRLDLFRAQALRAVGGNFWRMSHNPYSTATYDILDRLGVLAWDESRDFGMPYAWNMHDMVKRDRNHASVVVWSLCNEYECNAPSISTGRAFIDAARSVDTSRPFAANSNSQDNLYQILDVQGWSHRNNASMTQFHQQYPAIPEVLSECCSCTSQRLQFPRTTPQCIPSQNSPGLLPFVAGSLGVWTLMDYIGEPTGWPVVSSAFGQFDLAGFPKPAAYWYRANWFGLAPESDPGRPPLAGNVTVVRILDLLDQLTSHVQGSMDSAPTYTISGITNAFAAELFTDGVSQGQVEAPPGTPISWSFHRVAPPAPPPPCDFPVSLDGVQCRGLQNFSFVQSASECKSECCKYDDCSVWQYAVGAGCWVGAPNAYPCPPPAKTNITWAGGMRSLDPALPVRNATLVALDDLFRPLGKHTLLAPQSLDPAQLELTIDVPSPATGTGSALLLDGEDMALVRVSLLDASGSQITLQSSSVNITFRVVSGPGRLVGIGNGDSASHEQQQGSTASTYGGLARALVQVAVDCTSANRDLVRTIDADGNKRTFVLPEAQACPTEPIVVEARASGLAPVTISIPVSGDASRDSVSAVASASVGLGDGEYPYMRDFVG